MVDLQQLRNLRHRHCKQTELTIYKQELMVEINRGKEVCYCEWLVSDKKWGTTQNRHRTTLIKLPIKDEKPIAGSISTAQIAELKQNLEELKQKRREVSLKARSERDQNGGERNQLWFWIGQ